MARTASIPTQQELNALYERAERGDASALQELGELNNKIAKRANQRLRELEKKGYETVAYNRAKGYIQYADFGNNRYFSQSRKLDAGDALENLTEAAKFLRARTSLARGELERRENIYDTLVDKGYIEEAEDERGKNAFLEFLDTDAWKDIRKYMYAKGSGMLGDVSEAINNGAKVSDLVRAFKDYKQGAYTDIYELYDNWISADTYYRSGEWHELKHKRK